MASVHPSSDVDTLPLSGVVVLDLTQIYNGPYATMLMAQAGADIVKIEPPVGEHLRKRNRSDGVCQPFAALNGNKSSLCLNLKNAAARELFLRLVDKADVVVENFAPGAMDRLGLGATALRARNPRLIYASSSGYGSTGPYRDFPAMDLTVQAMSGVMSVTGMPDGPPLKAGPAVCDFFAGTHLYGAIVTALFKRCRTGQGSTVEVSMMSSVFPSLLSSLGLHRQGDRGVKRTGNRHGGLTMAPYNVYPTADGQVAILSVSDAHWEAIALVLGHAEWLADPRFADRAARIANMDALDEAIACVTASQAKDALFARLVAARVPSAPVRELDEVVNDAHLHASGMLRWVDHPVYGRVLVPGSPLVFEDQAPPEYRPSPALGADARDVLQRHLGTDAQAFDALVRQGALF